MKLQVSIVQVFLCKETFVLFQVTDWVEDRINFVQMGTERLKGSKTCLSANGGFYFEALFEELRQVDTLTNSNSLSSIH